MRAVLGRPLLAGSAIGPVAAQESQPAESPTAVTPAEASLDTVEAEGECRMTTNVWPPYTHGGATRYAEIESYNSCPWGATHRVSIQRNAGSYWESLNPQQATVAPGIWLTLISSTTKCIGEYDRYRTYASHFLPGGGSKTWYSTVKVFDC